MKKITNHSGSAENKDKPHSLRNYAGLVEEQVYIYYTAADSLLEKFRQGVSGLLEIRPKALAAEKAWYRLSDYLDDGLEGFRQDVSELLEIRPKAEAAEKAWYRMSDDLDDSLEGFRQDVSEILSAVILVSRLLAHRIHQESLRIMGRSRATGTAVVDRRFERHAENVYSRLKAGRLGEAFEELEKHSRRRRAAMDVYALKKHRFAKKVEAVIDTVIDRFLENRKRWTVSLATLACCFTMFCVTVNAGTVYNYYYHGTELGTVKDKNDVETAVEEVKTEVPEELSVDVSVNAEPNVDITYEKEFSFSAVVDSAEEIADKLAASDELEGTGYAISVNGVVVALVDTEDTANRIMQTVRENYVTADPAAEEELKAETESAEKVAYAGDEDGASDVSDSQSPTADPLDAAVVRKMILEGSMTTENGVISTETGDAKNAADTTAFSNIDFSQIDVSKLQGVFLDNVTITDDVSIDPVTAKVSDFNDYDTAIDYFVDDQGRSKIFNIKTTEIAVYDMPVAFETTYEESDSIYQGETQVKNEGQNGTKQVIASLTRENGQETGRTIINETVTQQPVNKVIYTGTKEKPSWYPTGTFIKPATGRFSSGFGRRWGRQHQGIDIAGSYGSDIVAADGGTVIYAGYNSSGYGNLVKIDHGNGYVTYYGHNSSLCVSVGDKVYQGQVIAKMGSTGRSTGNHCHFEVRVNGTPVNPLGYISC